LGSVAPNYNDLSVFKSTVKSVADSQKQFARDRVLDVYQVNQRNMPFDVARTLAPTKDEMVASKDNKPELPKQEMSFKTEQEAQQAYNSGKLKKGQRVIINGVSGTWN
jgi:hypothetical protein